MEANGNLSKEDNKTLSCQAQRTAERREGKQRKLKEKQNHNYIVYTLFKLEAEVGCIRTIWKVI